MASISPTRPLRRATARKNVVLEESDEENVPVKDEDSEEFTPAPRRQTRRKTTEHPATPRSVARTRITRKTELLAPSQDVEAVDNLEDPVSPTKKASPRKRKSVAVVRKSRVSASANDVSTAVPKISEAEISSAPLADITHNIVNEQDPPKTRKDFVPVKALDTVLEKPMDIVIRSRALPTAPVQPATGPQARTVIKNLVLNNFKSYAGRQEVGPFHASFSSVVGPNGSGKSNVIDSLLFVFGFRASKMRQGKISALIHNSAAFPDLEFCEVEVHFEEVMDKVDVPQA